MQLFYAPNIESTLELPADEQRHCLKVLRKQNGEHIHVIDGKGNLFECEIDGKKLKILLKTPDFGKRETRLNIVIAPTKNMDRLEWFVEKATEIGIDEITPIFCHHSERRNLKIERLQKKAISAMKQSLTGFLPKIHEPIKFKDFIEKNREGNKFIAHLSSESIDFQQAIKLDDQITIMIGPEGDFSNDEIQKSLSAGFKEVSLGQKRLRTETAALFATVIANS